MSKIVFDLGAAVRSELPWQGKNTKIQAWNGKDIDVHHFALLALAGAPWKFDAAWSAPLEARQQSFPSRRPWNPILSQLTENRDRCEFHVATIDLRSSCDATGRGGNWSTLRSNRMIWRVGKGAKLDIGTGAHSRPRFASPQHHPAP